MTAYRVTEAAKRDFRAVLKETKEYFGSRQREIYKRLIAKGVEMVAEAPGRGGSWDRGSILPGLRAFHLENAAGKRGAAAHTLYYGMERMPDGSPRVVILRLLHESMESRLHLARSNVREPSPTPPEPDDAPPADD
ncbi:toxin ParE1 [mine drainage metagenome]|uniref:Toxin ParE1 n=1 Tax=mine drainage metagenome TaxID=410659 RepID=A0A1J5SD96_9ZZZZ